MMGSLSTTFDAVFAGEYSDNHSINYTLMIVWMKLTRDRWWQRYHDGSDKLIKDIHDDNQQQ
jgi:hypothetical protein